MSLEPINSRVARLEELVRSHEALIRQLHARLARGGDPRNPRLARTTSIGTYPTRADAHNAWEIVFVDSTWEEDAGVQALDTTNRRANSPWPVAHNIYNDPFIPQGTLIQVWRDNNRWWFEYEDEIQNGVLQGTLEPGGSVSVKALLNGATVPGGAVQVYDRLGVMTGITNDKCYFKWQREHAQYWMIQKECDESVPSQSFVPIPSVVTPGPRSRERNRNSESSFYAGNFA